jgi:hypothetical protein
MFDVPPVVPDLFEASLFIGIVPNYYEDFLLDTL